MVNDKKSNKEPKSFFSVKNDKHSYKGWLNSDSYVKRAMSVFGYGILGQLLLLLLFALIYGVLLLLVRILIS